MRGIAIVGVFSACGGADGKRLLPLVVTSSVYQQLHHPQRLSRSSIASLQGSLVSLGFFEEPNNVVSSVPAPEDSVKPNPNESILNFLSDITPAAFQYGFAAIEKRKRRDDDRAQQANEEAKNTFFAVLKNYDLLKLLKDLASHKLQETMNDFQQPFARIRGAAEIAGRVDGYPDAGLTVFPLGEGGGGVETRIPESFQIAGKFVAKGKHWASILPVVKWMSSIAVGQHKVKRGNLVQIMSDDEGPLAPGSVWVVAGLSDSTKETTANLLGGCKLCHDSHEYSAASCPFFGMDRKELAVHAIDPSKPRPFIEQGPWDDQDVRLIEDLSRVIHQSTFLLLSTWEKRRVSDSSDLLRIIDLAPDLENPIFGDVLSPISRQRAQLTFGKDVGEYLFFHAPTVCPLCGSTRKFFENSSQQRKTNCRCPESLPSSSRPTFCWKEIGGALSPSDNDKNKQYYYYAKNDHKQWVKFIFSSTAIKKNQNGLMDDLPRAYLLALHANSVKKPIFVCRRDYTSLARRALETFLVFPVYEREDSGVQQLQDLDLSSVQVLVVDTSGPSGWFWAKEHSDDPGFVPISNAMRTNALRVLSESPGILPSHDALRLRPDHRTFKVANKNVFGNLAMYFDRATGMFLKQQADFQAQLFDPNKVQFGELDDQSLPFGWALVSVRNVRAKQDVMYDSSFIIDPQPRGENEDGAPERWCLAQWSDSAFPGPDGEFELVFRIPTPLANVPGLPQANAVGFLSYFTGILESDIKWTFSWIKRIVGAYLGLSCASDVYACCYGGSAISFPLAAFHGGLFGWFYGKDILKWVKGLFQENHSAVSLSEYVSALPSRALGPMTLQQQQEALRNREMLLFVERQAALAKHKCQRCQGRTRVPKDRGSEICPCVVLFQNQRRHLECPVCSGTGRIGPRTPNSVWNTDAFYCHHCSGVGRVPCANPVADHGIQQPREAPQQQSGDGSGFVQLVPEPTAFSCPCQSTAYRTTAICHECQHSGRVFDDSGEHRHELCHGVGYLPTFESSFGKVTSAIKEKAGRMKESASHLMKDIKHKFNRCRKKIAFGKRIKAAGSRIKQKTQRFASAAVNGFQTANVCLRRLRHAAHSQFHRWKDKSLESVATYCRKASTKITSIGRRIIAGSAPPCAFFVGSQMIPRLLSGGVVDYQIPVSLFVLGCLIYNDASFGRWWQEHPKRTGAGLVALSALPIVIFRPEFGRAVSWVESQLRVAIPYVYHGMFEIMERISHVAWNAASNTFSWVTVHWFTLSAGVIVAILFGSLMLYIAGRAFDIPDVDLHGMDDLLAIGTAPEEISSSEMRQEQVDDVEAQQDQPEDHAAEDDSTLFHSFESDIQHSDDFHTCVSASSDDTPSSNS